MGICVYAILRSADGEAPLLAGIFGRPVYRLICGELTAIVSDCPAAALRAERKHIAATQQVLKALNVRSDLLPMAFGTVARSPEALRDFIAEHRDTLLAQLERVRRRVEMSLRLSLDAADPIAHLVDLTPALKAARDRIFGRRRPPSYDERIQLGQLCDETLRRYRDAQTAQVLAMLGPSCAEIRALPVSRDSDLVNLALLVPRDGIDRFEAAVDEAAAQLPEKLAVTIGGPWPPHNFVQLEL